MISCIIFFIVFTNLFESFCTCMLLKTLLCYVICWFIANVLYIFTKFFVVNFMTIFTFYICTEFLHQFFLKLALRFDCCVSCFKSFKQVLFTHFLHFTFNHHNVFFSSTHHKIHISLFQLFESWINDEFTINTCYTYF